MHTRVTNFLHNQHPADKILFLVALVMAGVTVLIALTFPLLIWVNELAYEYNISEEQKNKAEKEATEGQKVDIYPNFQETEIPEENIIGRK